MKKQILTTTIFIILSVIAIGQADTTKAILDSNYSIQLIGDANSFKTLTETGSTPANASVGLLYTKYFKVKDKKKGNLTFHSAEISINFNVASTVDTLKAAYDNNNNLTSKSSFGSSVLLPGNSSQSTFFSAKVYFGKVNDGGTAIDYYDLKKIISGFYVNFNHAARNWYDSSKNIKASTISLSTGLFYDFIDYKARDKDNKKVKSIYAGLGYTGRWIVGDIALDENDNFRKRLLGSDKVSFHGVEFTLGAKIENARIELKIPILSKSTQVPGLSGTQPNYQIGFSGGITIK